MSQDNKHKDNEGLIYIIDTLHMQYMSVLMSRRNYLQSIIKEAMHFHANSGIVKKMVEVTFAFVIVELTTTDAAKTLSENNA